MRKLFLGLLMCVVLVPCWGQNYQLHSVYMYSFIKYVQWPSEIGPEFVIGVYGDSPILEHLKKMASVKKAGHRPIVIKKVGNLENSKGLNILFISSKESDQLDEIIGHIGGSHTLIISEGEGKGAEGSHINFVERGGKLAFELNKAAMERENLKVSSELTRLAIII